MQKEYFRIEFSNDLSFYIFKKRNILIEASVFHNYM